MTKLAPSEEIQSILANARPTRLEKPPLRVIDESLLRGTEKPYKMIEQDIHVKSNTSSLAYGNFKIGRAHV